jgi:hemerythrin-like metal-binding protein
MLKNIKISYKLALMVAIPIMGLIYFTIDSTLEKREIVNQMNLLQALSALTVKSSSLIHELQKERGLSAGFIGSQGAEFSQELLAQRVKTDKAIKKLDSFVKKFNFKPFGNEIKDTLEIIFVELNAIETRRNLVNQLKISVEEQIRYYTTIIDSLLIGINYLSKIITNAELSNQVVAYVNILQAKEKAGIERATLSNAFSRGHFAPGLYKKFILLVGAQDIYINNFLFFATPKQKQRYHNTMQKGPYVEKVKQIRKSAFKKAVKFQMIVELRAQVGYGGLIYQLNNYILWEEPIYLDAFHQQYQSASTILEIYKNLPYVSQSEIKNLEIIENTFKTYERYLATAIELKNQQKTVDEIDAIIEIDDAAVISALNQLLNGSRLEVEPTDWWEMATGRINLLKAIEDHISSDLKESAQALKDNAQSIFVFYLIFAGGTILLTLFLSYFFARGITKPLKALVQVAHKISSGDRNLKIQVESKDETGQLSSAMTVMLYSINRSEMMLRETNQAYARFVPNEFFNLLKKKDILDIQLGNHMEMNMTILFSDIRSFTALSEKMSPQDNFTFINAYLKEMGPIIREHNGFVDKYIGDAIMALFIKADDALNASISMLKKLYAFNNYQNNQKRLASIKTGIGLNTGNLMLGIIGEQNRLQCTVISDAVNLASRLEGATKTYKDSVIISQNTLAHLENPSQYAIRFLDNIKVKGRSKRVNIFEVFDGDPTLVREGKLVTLSTFEEAVHLYQKQKFKEALKLMQACVVLNPHDAPAEIYIQRCQKFLKINHSENWEEIARKIQWTADLLCNDPIIDEQHKELFFRLKNLIMSIGTGKTEEEVCEMISFLEGYVITHFEIEEMYMAQYNYPNHALHKEQHTQFMENLNQIKHDYKTNGESLCLALRLQQDIVDWLTEHIGKFDKDLARFMTEKG